MRKRALAIGHDAKANTNDSVVFGTYTKVPMRKGIAVGARAEESATLGTDSSADQSKISLKLCRIRSLILTVKFPLVMILYCAK